MISVAIATYNGEKYIIEQLESIKNQTVSVDEVIICDDCSKDNTVRIVNDYINSNGLDGWQMVSREKNLGFCMNFFDAISRTKGDYVFLCDQDDRWYENKVEEMLKLFSDSEVLSVACRHDLIDGDGNVIKDNPGIIFVSEKNDGSVEPITAQSQVGCCWIRGCSMCIRGSLRDNMTAMKLESLLAHDWMLNMEAALEGKSLYYNKYLFSYRYHHENTSLSAVSRNTLIGDYQKRITGLEQSVGAYEYLLKNKEKYKNLTPSLESDIEKQIKFENRRIRFLKNRNLFLFIVLFFSIGRYARYYASTKGGIKIWLGDLAYAYHKLSEKIRR